MNEITKYFPNLTALQREQFERLKPLYEEWNAKINVISRRDMEHFYEHHVLHSLAIARVCPFPDGARIMDVGTGGGFPGIPLAIMFPQARFWLVDSIGKKIAVVRGVAQTLGLTNVVAVNARAEMVAGKFDWVVSRAVTDMKTFLTWVDGKIAPSAASPQEHCHCEERSDAAISTRPAIRSRHSEEPPTGGVELFAEQTIAERASTVATAGSGGDIMRAKQSASAASPPKCHSERSEESSTGINHGILYLKGGDLTVEMQNAARPYTLYDIADLFAGDFFTTKHIVRIDY